MDRPPYDERRERREALRKRTRQQRAVVFVVLAGVTSFLVFYLLIIPVIRGGREGSVARQDVAANALAASPSPTAATGLAADVTPSASPTRATVTPSPDPTPHPPARPPIVSKPITFGADRRAQMAAYSQRHYGDSSTVLDPKVIVLHYTAGSTADSAWQTFQSNQPNVGELPGTVAHFIVDQDGSILQLVPLDLRGRHTIGLNHVAIGIEFVQEAGAGDTWAVGQIFHRHAQIDAGLRLVRWLQHRFGIRTGDVVGHGTANESRYFKDLKGWTNDHGDWGPSAVRLFHERLREMDGQ
jgi:hypothetical protein